MKLTLYDFLNDIDKLDVALVKKVDKKDQEKIKQLNLTEDMNELNDLLKKSYQGKYRFSLKEQSDYDLDKLKVKRDKRKLKDKLFETKDKLARKKFDIERLLETSLYDIMKEKNCGVEE